MSGTGLASQQLKATLGIAIVLAVVFGAIQIRVDLEGEREGIDRQMQRLVEVSRDSAARAAFTLDSILAQRIVVGIARSTLVSEVTLQDDFGNVIARAGSRDARLVDAPLQTVLFGEQRLYEAPLVQPGSERTVGTLSVRTDPSAVSGAFLQRAIVTATAGFARNLLLALALLFALQYTLTRPLNEVARRFDARTRRIEVPRGHELDELGGIVNAYNRTMAERDAAEQSLVQLKKSEATDKLAAGVAHDFNNILTVVAGNVQLMQLDDSRETRELSLAAIEQALERGSDLTRQLLGFSRAGPASLVAVRLDDVIGEFRELLRHALTPGMHLELDLCGTDWRCEVDRGELHDALVNLAVNASHAMQPGGVLTVRTFEMTGAGTPSGAPAAAGNRFVGLSVADTGCGIPEGIRDRIFDPFFTTRPASEGSGLGLSMVAAFARRHGARIAVESAPDQGTCLTFAFPRCEEADEPMPSAVSASGTDEPAKTILLVDDEPSLLDVVRAQLQSLGYTVKCATSGAVALQLMAREGEPDLVLSDVCMPGGMDGFELARAVRERWNQAHVLLMSGQTPFADTDQTFGDDGLEVLAKPFTAGQLDCAVRKALAPVLPLGAARPPAEPA